jgi:16S rRNA (uracil1498-N3)-methyltransferase
VSLPFFLATLRPGLAAGEEVTLSGEEAHHALVRRIRVGERVALTDGAGTVAECSVLAADRKALRAAVESVDRRPPESPRLVVVQAIPKGDRGELAVEMLTEVGVDVIVPWAAARSVPVWRGERAAKALARWRSTAREAAKQARRAWFPSVEEPASLSRVVELVRSSSVPVVLHEDASGPLADLPVPGRGEIVIVVGPEGGIATDELAAFAAAGAEPVRLGSSVLRTSTAGVAAAAALLARTPRWR